MTNSTSVTSIHIFEIKMRHSDDSCVSESEKEVNVMVTKYKGVNNISICEGFWSYSVGRQISHLD